MSQKVDLLSDEKITFEGIFDLKETYKHAYQWLQLRKFDVAEKKYKEKVKDSGKDLEIEWTATKDYDEYTKIELKIKWETIALDDVEVVVNNKKKKMNKGELTVTVTANLVKDWQDKWETSPFLQFMKGFYEKYLYNKTIDYLKKEVWKTGWGFVNETKAFLNLYRY